MGERCAREKAAEPLRYGGKGLGERLAGLVESAGRLSEGLLHSAILYANYTGVRGGCETAERLLAEARSFKAEVSGVSGAGSSYLREMAEGIEALAEILNGIDLPYEEAVRRMQGIVLREVPVEKEAELRERISAELTKKGYMGGASAISAWLRDTRLPREQVIPYARQCVNDARTACCNRVVALPDGEGLDEVASASGVFWSGMSNYLGGLKGRVRFNLDRPWSLPTFGNILCHECYPGHQAFYSHWDELYGQGRFPMEGAFYFAAGNPVGPVFEGGPENALHFLGWDDEEVRTPEIDGARKADYRLGRNVLDLQRMRQQRACYHYHVKHCGREEVLELLTADGLFSAVEAENTVRFFSDPAYRYYYPGYYYGRWAVYECYEAVPAARRGEFFRLLYDRPQTLRSLAEGVRELIGDVGFSPLAAW